MMPHVDSQAMNLLAAVGAPMRQAATLRAHTQRITYDVSGQTVRYRDNDILFLRAGGHARVHTVAWSKLVPRYGAEQLTPRRDTMTFVCTPAASHYYIAREHAGEDGGAGRDVWCREDITMQYFWNLSAGRLPSVGEWTPEQLNNPLLRSVVYLGRQQWRGVWYDVVRSDYEDTYTLPEDTLVYATQFFIDSSHTIRRVITTNNKGYTVDDQVLSLTLDVPMTAEDFVWTVPAGGKMRPPSVNRNRSFVGKRFPTWEIRAPLADGPTTSLKELLAGKRGALIWWWNMNCGPCSHEFPSLEHLYQQMKARGIEVIALDLAGVDSTEITGIRRMRAYNAMTTPIMLSKTVIQPLVDSEAEEMIVDSNGVVLTQGHYDIVQFRQTLETLAAVSSADQSPAHPGISPESVQPSRSGFRRSQ